LSRALISRFLIYGDGLGIGVVTVGAPGDRLPKIVVVSGESASKSIVKTPSVIPSFNTLPDISVFDFQVSCPLGLASEAKFSLKVDIAVLLLA
jgi:hypothetical protein